MRRAAALLALLFVAAATTPSQAQEAPRAAENDFAGVRKVFVDTGGNAAAREAIVRELTAADLGLQIVERPEDADIILRFNGAPARRARPLTAAEKRREVLKRRDGPLRAVNSGEESPTVSTRPAPGEGVVIIKKKGGGQVAATPHLNAQPAREPGPPGRPRVTATPAREFAQGFVQLYKTVKAGQP